MTFDLFLLHDFKEDKVPRNWIKFGGKKLMKKVRKIILEIIERGYLQWEIAEIISSKLKISTKTVNGQLWEIKNDRWFGRKYYIAIPILEQLIKLWKPKDFEKEKLNIIKSVELLVSNSSRSIPVKAIKNLSIELSRITGAHAADGTLAKAKTGKNSFMYLWRITDKDKNSLENLATYIKNLFDLDVKIRKSSHDNSFMIEVKNKVIFRYLNKILGFKVGDKTSTVSMPSIIKNSNLEIRKNFVLGIMTFDGCIDVQGYVRLGVKSKKLRDDVVNLLREDGIGIIISKSRKNEFCLRANIFKNGTKLLDYFAENTIQWSRAKFFIDNLNKEKITELFKGNKNNKVTLETVLEASKKLGTFDINLLINHLGVSKRTLRGYLRILEKSDVIEIDRSHHKLMYIYKS